MPKAAIDIGSNSILLTIVNDDGAILHDEARIVGLGKGLGDRGLFAPDRIALANEVLESYVSLARERGIDPISVKAVATSAARRAMNAQTVFERFQKNLGIRVRIISGDEEAQLTWQGAQRDLALPEGPALVVDLGGGSTELAIGEGPRLLRRASLELGSARLTERFLRMDEAGVVPAGSLEPLRAYVDAEMERYDFDPVPRTVIGVAGTVTTLMAMQLNLREYRSGPVHGSALTVAQLRRFQQAWEPLDRDARVTRVPFAPARADFLLAAAWSWSGCSSTPRAQRCS